MIGRAIRRRLPRRLIGPVLVILTVAAYWYAANRLFGYVCPSEILIGLPCPGCGLTRAALLLCRGDLAGSLRMNPMLLFVPAYFILAICRKKNAAENYLIFILVLSFVVYGWRMAHSFGTEPLVCNPNAIFSFIPRLLHHP